ncbi:MAG: DMT family transporter [Bacteroidia bacterium]
MVSSLKVHGALILVGLIYGANYSIAKSLMPDFIGAFGFILLRVVGALLFFLIAHRIWIKEKITEKSDYLKLAVCAFFGVATNMLCFFKGLSLTSPINASIIMTINPVIVLIFSAVLLKERVGWIKILGIAFGMTGAIMQIVDPLGVSKQVSGINWQGDLLVFANATSYAIYLVMVKPLMAKYHAFTVVKWTFTFGLLMVIPFGFSELASANWASINAGIVARLVFVVIGTTFLAYLLNAWALRYVNSSVVGVYIYLQPLLATIFAVAWAGYSFNWFMLIYAGLIFAGVYLVSFKPKSKLVNG